MENLDRISRILAQREQDADLLAELAAALLEIFQADRAFFVHPCDPDAAVVRIAMEATRPEYPGAFAIGEDIVADDVFRNILRQGLDHAGPVLTRFKGESAGSARRHGIQSQMTIGLILDPGPAVADEHPPMRLRPAVDRLGTAVVPGHRRAGRRRPFRPSAAQTLRKRERYRTVFENAHDAIIVHDFQGAIQAVSRTMLTLYGLEHEEALKATIADLSGPGSLSNPADDHWPRIARRLLHFEDGMRESPRMERVSPSSRSSEPFASGARTASFPTFGTSPSANGRSCVTVGRGTLRQGLPLQSGGYRDLHPRRRPLHRCLNDAGWYMMGYTREEMIGRTSGDRALDRCRGARSSDSGDQEDRGVSGYRRGYAARWGEEREQLWSAETITLDGQQVLLSHIYDITERKRAGGGAQRMRTKCSGS
ncbi:MAG: PAS domain S-box protein [Candidatus Competibacteraceae bacterium]